MTVPAARNQELGDFLRSRRARLQPGDVGIDNSGRRRTPGLRREEVAQLAGLSATYYMFLEQGRNVRPSPQVLEGLARALRLSPAERAHLHTLATGSPPSDTSQREALAPVVADLVSRLDPYPTFVKGRRWDILAANRAARALFADWPTLPVEERNELWWMFTNPRARDVYVDWESDAFAMLARFRLAAARRRDDPDFADLIERLHRHSSRSAGDGGRHEVLASTSGTKNLRHPLLGEVVLDHVVLQVADDPDQKLVTFAAVDGNPVPFRRLAASVPKPGARRPTQSGL